MEALPSWIPVRLSLPERVLERFVQLVKDRPEALTELTLLALTLALVFALYQRGKRGKGVFEPRACLHPERVLVLTSGGILLGILLLLTPLMSNHAPFLGLALVLGVLLALYEVSLYPPPAGAPRRGPLHPLLVCWYLIRRRTPEKRALDRNFLILQIVLVVFFLFLAFYFALSLLGVLWSQEPLLRPLLVLLFVAALLLWRRAGYHPACVAGYLLLSAPFLVVGSWAVSSSLLLILKELP